MTRGRRTGTGALAALLAVTILGFASPTHAQSPASETQDRWGITPAQWNAMTGPEARRRLGFPGAAPRVLAAARAGDTRAMAVISGAYAVGSGVPLDDAEAFRWAKGSADAGDTFGLSVFALDHLTGTGTSVDLTQYIARLRVARTAGSITAVVNLAAAYEAGEGVPRDLSRARAFYREAAEGGHPDGEMKYGLSFFEDQGGDDPAEGEKWLRLAAEHGQELAPDFVRALDLQHALARNVNKLFVSTWGQSLVGGHVEGLTPRSPCQSKIFFEKGGQYGSFLIDWIQSTGERFGEGLAFNGWVAMNGRLDEPRGRVGLTLHRNQIGQEEDKLTFAIDYGRQLGALCASMKA